MSVLVYDSNAQFYAEELAARVPALDYRAAVDKQEALALAGDAEVLVALAPFIAPDLVAAMPRLEWIQTLTTGVDNVIGLSDAALTNLSGFHGPQMSELAVLLMLACARRFPDMLDNQKARRWDRQPQPLLLDKTACIVGLGVIAEHLAGVLGAFGMTVSGVSGGRTEVPGFARVYPRRALADAASEADFLILLTPYTPETHHIVDAAVLDAMKPSAFLINIARGGCADEAAVAEALRSGRIAGAAIDVFAHWPLAPESPVWDLPNLIVTPQIGGYSDVYHKQALPQLAANMAAYAAGGVDALEVRFDR